MSYNSIFILNMTYMSKTSEEAQTGTPLPKKR